MPTIKNVEKRIWDVEGFDVNIKHLNGTDVRGDKKGIPQYPYERAAKNDMTVREWKNQRFLKNYPGYDIDILNGEGTNVTGQKKLGSVRDSYCDEE